MQPTTLTVNGNAVQVSAADDTPLLDVLRNHLGLDGHANSAAASSNAAAAWCWSTASPEKSCGKAAVDRRRQGHRDDRGAGHAGPAASAAAGLYRRAGRPVRLLPARHPDHAPRRCSTATRRRRGREIAEALDDNICRCGSHIRILRAVERAAAHDARRSRAMSDRRRACRRCWQPTRGSTSGCGFPTPGRVTVSTGRVEIGQGVLTAMLQIAAEELDVAPDAHPAADRRHRPDPERGLHRRQPVDPIRRRRDAPGLRRGARAVSRPRRRDFRLCPRRNWRCSDGAITHRGGSRPARITGRSPAPVDLGAQCHRPPRRAKRRATTASSGRTPPRVDLAAKVFGEPVFVHDMALDGMVHARVVRQPRRGATIATIDEAAIRRAAKGPIEIVRDGNFLAILGADETVVEAAAAVAPGHVAWDGVERDQPVSGRGALAVAAALDRPDPRRRRHPIRRRRAGGYEATYTRMHIAHASVAPSCGLAVYRDGQLTVWTHCQGVYPLRAALARTLEARSGRDFGEARAGAGLLRPQRRRRRGGRRGGHRVAPAGEAGPGALAARGGIRLRAGQPGDGGDGARRARRRAAAGRLDHRDLERPAHRAGRAAAATCSPPRRCPTRRPRRPPPSPPSPPAAPAPATASRSTTSRPSASSIT